MDSASDTIKALSGLGLGVLSREWIDEVWEQNFAESISLPDGAEGLLSENNWQAVVRSCREWLQSREGTPTAFLLATTCLFGGWGGGGGDKEQFMAIKDYTIIKTLPCLFVGQPTAESDGGEERASFWTVLLDAGLTHKQLLVGVVGVLDVRKEVRVVRRGCILCVACVISRL